jgi:hypothetical protein
MSAHALPIIILRLCSVCRYTTNNYLKTVCYVCTKIIISSVCADRTYSLKIISSSVSAERTCSLKIIIGSVCADRT